MQIKGFHTIYGIAFLLAICFAVLYGSSLSAQPPAGYYFTAENLNGEALRTELHNIIKQHSSVSYNQLWQSFYSTDSRPDNGKVWDIYSDKPGYTASYYFTFGSDQCGNYNSEGDCYNREHSVPKSWFGGNVAPMYTDLFHLYPTDGFVNGKRGSLPLGEVNNPTWTSTNGSKLGNNSYYGYSGQVFEPIDSFKGDLARTYMYMAVCYMDKNLGVESQSMFSGGNLKPWAQQMLLDWCHNDPVSKKEIDRNNAVYSIQHNRNPFIDFPELADKIFGNDTNEAFITNISGYLYDFSCKIYPNPFVNEIFVNFYEHNSFENQYLEIYDITGKCLLPKQKLQNGTNRIELPNLPRGIYFLKITDNQRNKTYKIIKQ